MTPNRSPSGWTTKLLATAVAAASLNACTLLKIQTPSADAVVTLPSATHVVVTSTYSISNVRAAVDGNDVSNQVRYDAGSGNYVGDVPLTGGMHTLVVSADAFCSTCSPQVQSVTDTRTFCVAAPFPFTSKTILSQADNLSWSSADARTVALATDTGMARSQWNMTNSGGYGSDLGIIQSTLFPCSCLRSPGNNPDGSLPASGTAVALAPCDNNDQLQVWAGVNEDATGHQGLYQFRANGLGSGGFGCLAEGTGGMVVLGRCDANADTPERLWKVRRQDNMEFETNPNPWEQ